MSFSSQVTDPEELRVLAQYKLWWRWYYAQVIQGFMDDFEKWLRANHLSTYDEYKQYETETTPGVYYLDLSSWCWKNHQDTCEKFMDEQGIA